MWGVKEQFYLKVTEVKAAINKSHLVFENPFVTKPPHLIPDLISINQIYSLSIAVGILCQLNVK